MWGWKWITSGQGQGKSVLFLSWLSAQAGNLAAALWHPTAAIQRLLPARLRP